MILLFCVVHKEFNNCITLLHIIQSVIIAVPLCVSTFVESKQLQINQELKKMLCYFWGYINDNWDHRARISISGQTTF